jgi:ABC-type amino acid transport substrate-binding protein
MLGRNAATISLGLALATLTACAPAKTSAPAGRTSASTQRLRVGVAAGSPPFAFWRGGALVGLELDFAKELATALGSTLDVRQLDWDDLIPALEQRRVDVIMSGMTITRARQVRIAFSEPYLISGLIALARPGNVGRYPDAKSVLGTTGTVGVVENTTGERFVRERVTGASVSAYPNVASAVTELGQRRIDIVVHDAPILVSFAAGNEAELAPVLHLLDREPLGWGMRRDDESLRAAANAALARWRTDGTRERILGRWVPYWSRLEAEAPPASTR